MSVCVAGGGGGGRKRGGAVLMCACVERGKGCMDGCVCGCEGIG